MSKVAQGEQAGRRTAVTLRGGHAGQARLVVLAGDKVGKKFTISGDSVVIGRSDEADIVLDSPQLSRRHARVRRQPLALGEGQSGYDFVLEDLDSSNGTYINGSPVRCEGLRFGDKIQVGTDVVLLFTRYDPVEEQILQRQRLENLGRLAAGVAHDINNMLMVMHICLDFLQTHPALKNDESTSACLRDLETATARTAELTPRLLAFTRNPARDQRRMNLSKLCVEVCRLACSTFERSIDIHQDIAPNLWVEADPVDVFQALMNLCLNARDAMPQGGRLSMRAAKLRPVPVDPSSPRLVEVIVEDTGEGMSEETKAQIFEPFFTTKQAGAGFGLGLATVREMVTVLGGSITVESELGIGTTFRVQLPLSPAKRRPAHSTLTQLEERRAETSEGGRLILVADDEEAVRRSIVRVLSGAGHQVIEAGNGTLTLAQFVQHDPPPDLVILDLDMAASESLPARVTEPPAGARRRLHARPVVFGGEDTYHALRQLKPDVRVLFISGHRDAGEITDEAPGYTHFLSKPHSTEELLEAVRAILPPRSA